MLLWKARLQCRQNLSLILAQPRAGCPYPELRARPSSLGQIPLIPLMPKSLPVRPFPAFGGLFVEAAQLLRHKWFQANLPRLKPVKEDLAGIAMQCTSFLIGEMRSHFQNERQQGMHKRYAASVYRLVMLCRLAGKGPMRSNQKP